MTLMMTVILNYITCPVLIIIDANARDSFIASHWILELTLGYRFVYTEGGVNVRWTNKNERKEYARCILLNLWLEKELRVV